MTPRTWQLLRLLADGGFHSGDTLGRQLGVSRATVCSDLQHVVEYGIDLHRIRGRGYRLSRRWQPLDGAAILSFLAADAQRFHIEVLQQAASSNTELLRRAALGVPGGSVLAVELQTAGRGRIGRAWHSGLGNALTFSLLWRFDCGLNGLAGLSLAVGVAIVRALETLGADGAVLKWPNDILTAHGKLGGVLLEAQGDMYGPSAVVIGIGLNCTLPKCLAEAISQPASALDEICPTLPDRNLLLATLLRELARVLDEFAVHGFAALRAEWELRHARQNQPVRLIMPDASLIEGVARGVSETGELMLATDQGIRCFNSGEVAL